MEWRTRRAVAEDVPEIASINVAAWRSAYRGIVPQAVLDGMSEQRRAAGWSGFLREPEPTALFVAVRADGRIGAYCSVGAVRLDADAHRDLPTGELFAIYAAPDLRGTGAGHAVHEHAREHLAASGFRHAVLWVLVDNAPSRRFYEAHGWRCDDVVQNLRMAGEDVVEVRYSRSLG
ncbi:GNAT family N-acetyltransferase [Streptoalloteichus tenebrarius]